MVTAEVPTEINIDISGLLEIASKSLYTQQLQLVILCIILGVLVVLVMIGGAKN